MLALRGQIETHQGSVLNAGPAALDDPKYKCEWWTP